MKQFTKLIIASLLSMAVHADEVKATGSCYALALSSGDETAAYQAGVLSGIFKSSDLTSAQKQYDSVSGISGGALNAAILSNYSKGQEGPAADRMEKLWTDASNTKLYKDWFGGIARGLFFEGGLYNSAPLEDFLKKEYTNITPQRNLNLGIVDVVSGDYRAFTEKNITAGANLVDAMYASLSFAGFFPPADVLNTFWFDGSAVWDIDIFSAINACKAKGFQNNQITVDVVMTSSANLKNVSAADYKSIQMLFRYLEISSYYNSMDGYLRAKFAYPGVDWRYVISPTESIPSSIYPFAMNQKQMEKTFALGVKDADAAIAGKVTSEDAIHYHALKKTGRDGIAGHTLGSFIEAKRRGEFQKYDIMQDPYMRKYTYKVMQN